ncbi:hypothetical protein N9D23_05510 [Rubripirellula sp.]|nr:hypothetical protein [Rubripirellula sp.]MDF1843247.1 hypothetical protein [Rubripirellula sp.]
MVPLNTFQIDEDAPEQTVNLESIHAGGGEGELVLTYPGVSSGRDPIEASAGFYEMPLSIESVPRQRLGSRPCWFSSKQADSIQSDHERAKSEEEIGIDSLGSVDQLFGDEQFLETVLLKTR